jgi:tetratricopeptide (TPR) repeat protein
MRSRVIFRALKWTAWIAFAVAIAPCLTAAQEAGGDLGGGAGIFRPKNPETSGRRTGRSGNPKSRTGNSRRTGKNAAEIASEIEDLLADGNEARDTRNFPEAEKAYRAAMKLNARNWRAAYGLGNIYADQQRWEEAEKAYRQAAEWNPLNSDTFIALSYALMQPMAGGSQAKRLADAEMAARRAIMLDGQNPIAYDRLGAAQEARGLPVVENEKSYRKAVELDPQFAVGYVHLARLIRKDSGRRAEAEPLYGRAMELAKDAPTLVLIADALQSEQRYQDSEKPLRAALELDPKNPNALFLLGRMLVVYKKYSEAQPFLEKAIEISPRSFAPYEVLGSAYLQDHKYDQAERVFTQATEIATLSNRRQLAGSFGLAGVADGYIGAGRAQDAVRVYQAALKLDPENAELQRKLADANSRLR